MIVKPSSLIVVWKNHIVVKVKSNFDELNRTKMKQTEVDCEYLKRCYETLTEENRRLQKEVHELKVLNTSQPFYNQLLPPTTLTMCFSCERVASTAAAAAIDTARTRH